MLTPFINTSSSHSLIRTIDPRVRVIAASGFAIMIAMSEKFSTLGSGLGIALGIMILAGIVQKNTLYRFLGLNGFMFFLLVMLPLSVPGRIFLKIGDLVWSVEGLQKAVVIALKANTIMLAFAALIATIDPTQLGGALRKLGCPEKLTHLLFFVIRYLDIIHKEYLRLVNAMKLRCFRPGFNRHTFRTYGYLVGMLLVKSIDRSERILEAMKCRGFRNKFYSLAAFRLTIGDATFIILCSSIVITLGVIEWI